jgi:hypothetical protein
MKLTLIERKWYKGTTHREFFAAPRMYVSVTDETIIDNLMNRKRRPYNVYKTLLRGSLLEQVLDLGNLKWSQHAGCTCNCSPGFILPSQQVSIGGHEFRNFDLWVDLATAPSVNEKIAPRLIAAV